MALEKTLMESVKLVNVPPPSASVARLRRRHDAECCCSTRMLLQNHENFKNSTTPARVMYYDDGAWADFPADVLVEVKSAFADRRPMVELEAFGSDHLFDFLRMAAVEFESGRKWSISWIDDKGNCFFPKEFFGPVRVDNDDENDQTIEVEIRIDCDALLKRKREEKSGGGEEEEVSSTKEVPKRQRLLSDSKWPNASLMREGERAHSLVSNYFMLGMRTADPGALVTAIHQCTRGGDLEKARHELFKRQEEVTKAARGGSANTVYAWYGASRKDLESILVHGFGAPNRVSGRARDYHGIGQYLSPVGLPHLSAQLSEVDDKGEKHLLLCRVILGNVEKVETGSQQCYPSSPNFDTGSNDPNNPTWYIVWPTHMSRHITPVCVLSFKPSNHGQATAPPVEGAHYSFDTLIPKLKNSLPAPKSQEVLSLYDTYKAGKLARDIFLKQLRCVAGDQVLISVVREIRGF